MNITRIFPPERESAPYGDASEYLGDWLKLLRMLLEILSEQAEIGSGAAHLFLPVSAPVIERGGREDVETDELREAALRALTHIVGREDRTRSVRLPLRLLRESLPLTSFMQLCLLAAIAPSFDRSFEALYAKLQGSPAARAPTLGLCAALFHLLDQFDSGEAVAAAAGQAEGLRLLVDIDRAGQNACMGYTLYARPLTCRFLRAPNEMYEQNSAPVMTLEPGRDADELELYPELQAKLSRFIAGCGEDGRGEGTLLYLCGAQGSGKKRLLLSAASGNGRLLTICDYKLISRLPQAEARETALGFLLECILRGSLPVLSGVTPDASQQAFLRYVTDMLLSCLPNMCVTGSCQTPPDGILPLRQKLLRLETPRLSTLERRAVWQTLAHDLSVEPSLDPASYANKFHYTPGQVRQILERAGAESALDGRETVNNADVLISVELKNAELTVGGRVTKVECVFSWDDLVLPKEQLDVMRSVVHRVRYEHVVNGEWGFGRKLPYGRGVSVVVYGPPGTGKTMSAQVMARELDIALYRADLSQMVSKYIGETEKNLSEVFAFAERSGCILFFDEADALFGKRTEVKDAHDKYANVETSYLLQKIEEHDGISILSTNNLNNIDIAFRRRFTYLINIPKPDAATRLLLWEKAFPKGAPLAPGLRFEKLAEQLEITGSAIKSAAVDAAYRAAAEGSPVEFRHLLEAVKLETLKNAMPLTESDLLALVSF